ncbi:MAG: winged helix-turn-helix domain-containing protein [Pseudomonadota bacterium]
MRFDQFEFDASDGSLRNRELDRAVSLRPQVGHLLSRLLEQPNRVVDRESIRQAVWGEHAVVDFESGLAAIIKELRQSLLELDGAAETIETIPRRGYRLNATRVGTAEGSESLDQPRPVAATWRWVLTALLLVVLAVAVFAIKNAWQPAPLTTAQSLVILPFERYGALEQAPAHAEFLVADTLLARLWEADLDDLVLIGRSSVIAYADQPNVAAAVAEELNAHLILEGDLVGEADRWRVEARLLSLPSGQVIWSETVLLDQQSGAINALVEQLVSSLSKQWPELRRE